VSDFDRYYSIRRRIRVRGENEEELPMQPPQPQIDYAVLEQINEFSKKTQTLPLDLINHVLRLWLDVDGAAKLVSLGLEPMTPRFDGTAGYGCSIGGGDRVPGSRVQAGKS
jgi:hypothetical protein